MAWGKSKSASVEKSVDMDLGAEALAKAVHDGDMVNFRLLFLPFSPLRKDSSERLEDEKYAYLRPDSETQSRPEFREALAVVRERTVWQHIESELAANRPAQLPWELVLLLGDNAVRLGKYTNAAQAYEVLRIRRKMQEEFFRQADEALDAGKVKRGVRGYVAATSLEYDYAAFPEPLPKVPDFQRRALILHGVYPERVEDCLPLQELEAFLRAALTYLLLDAPAAARLESRPVAQRLAFLAELVQQRDPEWRAFVHRYREACDLMRDFDKRITRATAERGRTQASLAGEIEEVLGQDPRAIPSCLLGRTIENGEWWQYMQELAYLHPAAALFVSRQLVGDVEILVPRYRADSPVPRELGLITGPGSAELRTN
ncbi:MAG: hypothetical protein IT365_20515 [Candidatus Hydrogenedentes bacterium]|nr:hypothetical protein [Candidatus Hydrogenedentota bacterium]